MCEPGITWSVFGVIAGLIAIALMAADLLLRYLNNDQRGLIPYRAIIRPFFLLDEKTFQEVDEKYRRNQRP